MLEFPKYAIGDTVFVYNPLENLTIDLHELDKFIYKARIAGCKLSSDNDTWVYDIVLNLGDDIECSPGESKRFKEESKLFKNVEDLKISRPMEFLQDTGKARIRKLKQDREKARTNVSNEHSSEPESSVHELLRWGISTEELKRRWVTTDGNLDRG